MSETEDRGSAGIVCDLSAIDAADRMRHKNLLLKLRAAQHDVREASDGYSFLVDHDTMPLRELAEWMDLERRCCPFLTLTLEVRGHEAGSWVKISGPAEAKPIIQAELAVTTA